MQEEEIYDETHDDILDDNDKKQQVEKKILKKVLALKKILKISFFGKFDRRHENDMLICVSPRAK